MIINTVIPLFRGYSKATAGGGAIVDSTKGGGGVTRSTSSGGGSTPTSSSGGGTSKSTESGGGSSETSTVKIFEKDRLVMTSEPSAGSYDSHYHLVNITQDGIFDHNHSVTIPAHSHEFNVPAHIKSDGSLSNRR